MNVNFITSVEEDKRSEISIEDMTVSDIVTEFTITPVVTGTYTCSACYKSFKSKHTLQIHSNGMRHTWHVKQMKNDLVMASTDSISNMEDILFASEKKKERRTKRVDTLESLSEEGYCTDDENKKQLTNGHVDEKNDTVEKVNNNIHDNDNSKENNIDCDNKNDNEDLPESQKCRRSSSKPGTTRRRKMEELKEMYKRYAASRASNDLYSTMLDSYEDFAKDYEDYEMYRKTGFSGGTPESFPKKRSFSEREKEALMKRDMTLTELADTEKDYVDALGFIVNDYIPLLEQEEVSKQLKDDFEKIFSNIYDLYIFHKRYFLECLEECLETPSRLKETFCNCEEDLSVLYSQYCKGKPVADEALKTNEIEMETIRKCFFPDMKLTMKDLLVKPVQRLMKYQLLLCTARKYSFAAGVSTRNIDDAIEVMDYVPKEANDAMHVALIFGYDSYLLAEDLLYQDALEVAYGKNKTKSKSMRVFIFESVVIFSETIKRKGRLPVYKCVAHGKTSSMGITEVVENDQLKFAIYFRKFKTTDIFVCKAESPEIRVNFVTVLTDVIGIYEILQRKVRSVSQTSRQSSEVRRMTRNRTRTVILDRNEAIKLAMQGHPRKGSMSERLQANIEKFILNEIMNDDSNNENENESEPEKIRSMSLIPNGTSAKDVKVFTGSRKNSTSFMMKSANKT